MEIKFIKSPTGAFNLAYFPGETADMPDHQAQELIESGYAEQVHPVLPHQEVCDLPGDLPGRKIILDAGVKTLKELSAYDELTEIPGVGKMTARKIREYLDER